MSEKISSLKDEGYAITTNVDWLTMTTTSRQVGQRWQERYMKVAQENLKNGEINPGKRWSALGYQGASCPGVRWGFSERLGWIVILSGDIGDRHWRSFCSKPAKATRIDLAVTVKFGVEFEGLPEKYYSNLDGLEKKPDGRGYSLVKNTKGGQTLYVGSRKSEKFGRVYDKGVQEGSSPPGFKYRFEVEYKKPSSETIRKSIQELRERERGAILNTVHGFFERAGVVPVWRKNGDAIKLEAEAKVTTAQKKIIWLSSQVRPTVQKLILAGYKDEVVDALGLTHLTGPISNGKI